jgi:hypothetical protein
LVSNDAEAHPKWEPPSLMSGEDAQIVQHRSLSVADVARLGTLSK